MQLTARNFVFVLIVMSGFGAGVSLGKANFGSATAERPIPVIAEQTFDYFPAQYTLNAPNQVNEHIQAF